MKEAKFYSKLDNYSVKCHLCPHQCTLAPKKYGICRVRYNDNGRLVAKNYGKISSLSFDPIEKKPLYHYYPGQPILSVGSVGCNLDCQFCQNHDIAQSSVEEFPYLKEVTPEEIVAVAQNKTDNIGIAYTYNEPTVYFELMLETAKIARQNQLKNVMVTNGFIEPEPLQELLQYVDAFSVDLKAFTNDFYKKHTNSRLEPVKESLKMIKQHNKHLEITNLLIPNLNDNEDSFKEMLLWIREELGQDSVLHISRYFPRHKMTIPATPVPVLLHFYHLANQYLDYVYLGNINSDTGKNTYCNNCKNLVIKRNGYLTNASNIDAEGRCEFCGQPLFVP